MTVTDSSLVLKLWEGSVLPNWLDYNQHMTEHRYLQVFGEASDALYKKIGIDFNNSQDSAYYTLESHICHLSESKLGTPLYTETEILGYDEKRLHIWHKLLTKSGHLLATGEHISIHVKKSKSQPTSKETLSRIQKIFDAQRHLERPVNSGKVLKFKLPNSR